MIFKIWRNQSSIIWVLCAAFVAFLYTYSVMMQEELGLPSDFDSHVLVAQGILDGKNVPPHFLYHFALIFIHQITGLSFVSAEFVFVFSIVFYTFTVAYKSIEEKVIANKNIVSLMIIFLLLSHPVAILAPIDEHIYFGYIASNVYHNPTILLLKPVALLHFILICKIFGDQGSLDEITKKYVALAILTTISIIAKPNYIIVLIPALFGLMIVNSLILKRNMRVQELIAVFAIAIPTIIVLVWQYLWYFGGENKSYIDIGLFAVFKLNSALWTLIPKLVLSVAFPLSVALLLGVSLLRKTDFQLAFFMFVTALLYSYVLVDGVNGRIANGNFWWSAQISHFILLYICIKHYLVFLYDKKISQGKYSLVPMMVGICQLFFGLLWYYKNVSPDSGMSW